MLLGIEQGDLERIGLAELESLAELFLRAEFADVDEAGDAFLDRGERAVLVELDDDAGDGLVFLVFLGRFGPRILLELL